MRPGIHKRALQIWAASERADGTLVETYLHSRRIVIPIPPSIRFHPSLRHRSGEFFPAMVALVTRGATEDPVAVHRTFSF